MPTASALRRIAKARLRDADCLFRGRRYHGAHYLCGYAIELALKASICRTLKWKEYQTSRDYTSFKTHDFEVLLSLTGYGDVVHARYLNDWSKVAVWKPEMRYDPVGRVTRRQAQDMIASTRRLLDVL